MTDFEDLKKAWLHQPNVSPEMFTRVGRQVETSSNLLRSKIFWRDMVELGGAIIVVIGFGAFAMKADHWLGWSGCMLIVITAIMIPFIMWNARKRASIEFSSATFRGFVDEEVGYLVRQIKMIRHLAWWYLAPIYVGMVLICLDMLRSKFDLIGAIVIAVMLVGSLALFVWLWFLNQRARVRHLEPLLDHYLQMQMALETGDDSAMPTSSPPTDFLNSKNRDPIGRLHWWLGLATTVCFTGMTLGVGIHLMRAFDHRTGAFIASCTPVVALLLIVITRIWRRVYGYKAEG